MIVPTNSARTVCAGILLLVAFSGSYGATDRVDEERQWLERLTAPIRVGITEVPPQTIFERDGEMYGLAVDFYREIEAQLGVRFEYLRFPNWASLIEAGRRREIDIVFAAQDTRNRRRDFLFTRPYVRVDNRILVRTETAGSMSVSDLSGKQVLVISGSALEGHLTEDLPGIEVRPVASAVELLRQLAGGQGDAGVLGESLSAYYLKQLNLDHIRVAGSVDHGYDLAVAIRRDWPLLQRILDRAIETIPASRKDALYLKWRARTPHASIASGRVAYLLGTIAFLGLSTAITVGWNRRLNAEIRKRTEIESQLSAANTALTEARMAAERQARTDHLTGVPNRRGFFEMLQMEHAEAFRSRKPLALIMLQLDGLDDINDRYGPLGGDEVLIEIAHRMRETLRADRYLGRLGGGRFGVILPGSGLPDALALGETMRMAIEHVSAAIQGQLIRTTMSAGATAIWPPFTEVDTVERLLSRADRALARARSQGANRVCTHEPAGDLKLVNED